MIAYCQLGFSKNIKEGQILEIYLNGKKLKIEKNDGGQYLTPMSQRRTQAWYLKPFDCNVGDVILLRCKTGLRMLGPDEKRTFDAVYSVESKDNVAINLTSIGFGKDFPILKGPITQVSFVTSEDLRLAKATGMLTDSTEEPT
jgi:hypothetical protein